MMELLPLPRAFCLALGSCSWTSILLLLQQLPQSAMVFFVVVEDGVSSLEPQSFGDGLSGFTKRSLGCSELFQLLTNWSSSCHWDQSNSSFCFFFFFLFSYSSHTKSWFADWIFSHEDRQTQVSCPIVVIGLGSSFPFSGALQFWSLVVCEPHCLSLTRWSLSLSHSKSEPAAFVPVSQARELFYIPI